MGSWMKQWVIVGALASGMALMTGCSNRNPAESAQRRDLSGSTAANPSGGVGGARYSTSSWTPSATSASGGTRSGAASTPATGGSGKAGMGATRGRGYGR